MWFYTQCFQLYFILHTAKWEFEFEWGVILGANWSKVVNHWWRDDLVRLGNKMVKLQWRHNGRDSVSNHQPHDCLLNRLFRRRSKKTSKLRVTGLCEGNSPGTGEFPAQMASNAENVSTWWRHQEVITSHGFLMDVVRIHALTSTHGCGWLITSFISVICIGVLRMRTPIH